MNYLDIAILLLLLLFLVKGLVRGLVKEFFSLFGLIAGTALAFRFCQPLAETMRESLHLPAGASTTVAFLALFLTTVLFFSLLGYLLSRFVKLLFLGGLNRVAGGFFGLAQGTLLLAILLFAAAAARPLPARFDKVYRGSQLAPPFVGLGTAAVERSRHLLTNWH
jgi:membrane protein required for colicin V production